MFRSMTISSIILEDRKGNFYFIFSLAEGSSHKVYRIYLLPQLIYSNIFCTPTQNLKYISYTNPVSLWIGSPLEKSKKFVPPWKILNLVLTFGAPLPVPSLHNLAAHHGWAGKNFFKIGPLRGIFSAFPVKF